MGARASALLVARKLGFGGVQLGASTEAVEATRYQHSTLPKASEFGSFVSIINIKY